MDQFAVAAYGFLVSPVVLCPNTCKPGILVALSASSATSKMNLILCWRPKHCSFKISLAPIAVSCHPPMVAQMIRTNSARRVIGNSRKDLRWRKYSIFSAWSAPCVGSNGDAKAFSALWLQCTHMPDFQFCVSGTIGPNDL